MVGVAVPALQFVALYLLGSSGRRNT